MPASIRNPADVVNLALVRIGYTKAVGNLYDGSDAANKALTIYAQTRDDLMRDGEWDFCRRDVAPTLLKSGPDNYFDTPWDGPTMPPAPWRFEYAYPGDCLKVRRLSPAPGFTFNPAPQPTLFQVANDQYFTPARRVILCNIQSAILTYAGQVTDPASWPPDFVEAAAAELAIRLKRGLMGEVNQVDTADVNRSFVTAMQEQG
jgi:hypothetical protein